MSVRILLLAFENCAKLQKLFDSDFTICVAYELQKDKKGYKNKNKNKRRRARK